MPKNKKVLVLALTNKCNNACAFCNSLKEGRQDAQFILRQIKAAANKGFKSVDFTGSEPTLNEYIFTYIKKAKENGFEKLTLFTNGRRLYYKKFCAESLFSGITKIIFSIYSHDGRKHDQLMRSPNSYDQLIEGIRNAKNLKAELGANLVVGRRNIHDIYETIKFFHGLGIEFFMVSPVLPDLYNDFAFQVDLDKDFILSYRETKRLAKVLGRCSSSGLDVCTNFIPFCFHPEKSATVKNNRRLSKVIIVSESGKKTAMDEVVGNMFSRKEICVDCTRSDICEGELNTIDFQKKYLSFWLASDLHASADNAGRLKSVFEDAGNVIWDKALFVGDTVKGDRGKTAFEFFNRFSNRTYVTWN